MSPNRKDAKKETIIFDKVQKIFLNAVPIILMIALIPLIKNDYFLGLVYLPIIVVFLLIKYEEKDLLVLIFGIVIMVFFEYIFIVTGVETFNRNSLFGIMPVWLPLLWGCAFVAMKRTINILR